MAINYQKTVWNNEQEPPISAANLNHIEQGIKATADRVDELVTVEANPSETPTATMESLEVDGTIYKVGGGHAVKDSSGNTMTQRENLQFKDAHTSDDSQGNTTKVEIAKQVTSQEWENATEKGFYLIGDDDDYLLDISQVANADAEHLPYSSTQSTKDKIDEVNGKVIIGTPTAGESYTTLYRGQYVRIGNLVMVSAVIGVNVNLTANYRILNDLPTVADSNSNVGFANPQHTESNTSPMTIRMYDKGLYTNKANELVANKVYYLSAMYITSDN